MGFDTAGMDAKTKPGDDFFRYANGTWLDKTQIPGDKPAVSLRLAMTDRTEGRMHEIMEAAANKKPTDLEGKVGAFYHAFMDQARVDALGAKPLGPPARRRARRQDARRASRSHGRGNADLEGTLFNFFVDVDLKDPKHYVVYLGQGGLGLPDRDYYLKPDFAAQKTKYQAYVAPTPSPRELARRDARAKDVVDFETKIAQASWTKAEQRDADKVYNPMTVAELEKFAPGFAWKDFLAEASLGQAGRVIVGEKSAFPKLAGVFAATPVETLQAWQAFHIADNAAPYLSKPFTDAYFEMRDKTLSGQKEQKVRWKRAVFAVAGGDFLVGDRFGTYGTMGLGARANSSARNISRPRPRPRSRSSSPI